MVNEVNETELNLKDREVKKNMLKDRAKKADDITDEMFEKCNKENRDMYKEYFSVMKSLSAETAKQYRTCLKQFFYFVYTELNDKPIYKITKLHNINNFYPIYLHLFALFQKSIYQNPTHNFYLV